MNTVIVNVTFLHETEKAILIEQDEEQAFWLAKSQIENFDENTYEKGNEIEIEIPDWIAEENDLEEL